MAKRKKLVNGKNGKNGNTRRRGDPTAPGPGYVGGGGRGVTPTPFLETVTEGYNGEIPHAYGAPIVANTPAATRAPKPKPTPAPKKFQPTGIFVQDPTNVGGELLGIEKNIRTGQLTDPRREATEQAAADVESDKLTQDWYDRGILDRPPPPRRPKSKTTKQY